MSDADTAAKADSKNKLASSKLGNTDLDELKGEVERLTENSMPQTARTEYVEALRTWTKRRKALIGTTEKRDSLTYQAAD